MRLTFRQAYKSITTLPAIELPEFVVLTGVNGAGKTHLLEAIANGSIRIDDITTDNNNRQIRLFNWSNLVPNDSGAVIPYQLAQERNSYWTELSSHINSFRPQVAGVVERLGLLDRVGTDVCQLVHMKKEDFFAKIGNPELAEQAFQEIQNAIATATSNVENLFLQNDPVNRRLLIEQLKKACDYPIIGFEENDFFERYPISWTPVDLFQQSFSRLFAAYYKMQIDNKFRKFLKSEGENVHFLSEQEFFALHGEPPWNFVNSIFSAANLDFRITQPQGYDDDRLYEPLLHHQLSGDRIRFADLSSGERILLSFTLCLYYAEDRRQIVDYPKVLLFDEIDAPLHPSMTQSLLRIIQEILIERHQIKVILTTHSPSTVALAPEPAIFVMRKDRNQRLEKTSKDRALTILTSGVPTLSIDYKNRRQVFVESRYDVEFYEQIFNKLKSKLIPEISLNFISSGVAEKGSCDQVKEIVNKLTSFGNRTVYGIIDWDLKNNGNERVKVLGQGKRYSIENYIFDPILLAAFLIREKFVERSTFGLSEDEKYADFEDFDNTRLQSIVDFIASKVSSLLPSEKGGSTLKCEYVGGQQVNIPVWFLGIQGHKLEDTLKQIFPQLNRFRGEVELKREILRKVVDDLPHLLSIDFVSLFREIQNINT